MTSEALLQSVVVSWDIQFLGKYFRFIEFRNFRGTLELHSFNSLKDEVNDTKVSQGFNNQFWIPCFLILNLVFFFFFFLDIKPNTLKLFLSVTLTFDLSLVNTFFSLNGIIKYSSRGELKGALHMEMLQAS